MGALIAALNKKDANASDSIFTMLETLSHRGSDSLGIASAHEATIGKTVEDLEKEFTDSNVLIGHNFVKILSRDISQPIQKGDFSLVFEGRLFPPPSINEGKLVAEMLTSLENKEKYLIRRLNGDYIFAIAKSDKIIVGRDPVGICPLYFGENEDVYAIASERKALWKIGIEKVNFFPPGRLAVVNKNGFHFENIRVIVQPSLQKLNMEDAAQRLTDKLLQSTKERISDVKEVAVAFSGGIDSSIIAFLAKLCDVNVHLIYVTLENRDEIAFVEQAARALELPLHIVAYSIDEVEETLPRVLWLIEEPNPQNVSIGIPMFWVAKQSAKLDLHILMAGQGGDELFGGYYRYLEDYAKHGLAGVRRRLYRDVISSFESNFQRDNKVCAFHKVELRLPFIDWEVIRLALSVPAELKIASLKDTLRKRVLRYAAKKLGIPELITQKPKKAIQYTTGVNRAIKKLAKEEGLTPWRYMEKAFEKAYRKLD